MKGLDLRLTTKRHVHKQKSILNLSCKIFRFEKKIDYTHIFCHMNQPSTNRKTLQNIPNVEKKLFAIYHQRGDENCF